MLLIFPVLLLVYLLLGLSVSIGVARWSGRRFQSRIAPWLIFIVLFTAFFGDEIYGYWHWQNLCKTEGGLHVYKRVLVEGFRYKAGSADAVAKDFLEQGYRYVEGSYSDDYDEKAGRQYRYTLGNDGKVKRTSIDESKSRHIFYHEIEVPYPPYVWGHEILIRDRITDETLSANRSFGYKGATIIRALRAMTGANFEGSADYCGESAPIPQQLNETIPPFPRKNQQEGGR